MQLAETMLPTKERKEFAAWFKVNGDHLIRLLNDA